MFKRYNKNKKLFSHKLKEDMFVFSITRKKEVKY